MAELVRQHRLDLRVGETLEQRVEEHDALVPADAGEVGVAVARAPRVVHDEYPLGGEAAARQQRFDASPERLVSSGEKRLKSGAMNAGQAQAMRNMTPSHRPTPMPTTSCRRVP